MSGLRDKIGSLKERLLDPFKVEGLEREFEELLELMQSSSPEELHEVREEFEKIKELLYRNVRIISGGLEPLLKRQEEGFFSRRV